MKDKKRIYIITLFVLLFSYNTYALDDITSGSSGGEFLKVGAAGAQFLKIGVGARGTGMAGAFGSLANDLTAIHWNPAGIADIKGMSGNFNYTQWFAGFKHSFAAFALPVGDNFTAAAHVISFSSDRIEITTLERPQGTGLYYSVNDIALGLSFGGYLTDQFSFGITAKLINSAFSSISSSGFAFDVGTMYETGIQGIKLGFSIHNLGTEQTYSGQALATAKKLYDAMNAAPLDVVYVANSFSIPLIFRAGASSTLIEDDMNKLIAALDFVTLSDTPEQFALGLEYTYKGFLSLRGGYRLGQDQFNLAGGIGLNYIGGGFIGQLDYSINPTKDLGLVNRISINVGLK